MGIVGTVYTVWVDPGVYFGDLRQSYDQIRVQSVDMYLLGTYLIIVTDATDAVSVNFSGRCKFLQI